MIPGKRLLFMLGCLGTACIICSKSPSQATRVYVRNCTSLQFDVFVAYESTSKNKEFPWQRGTRTLKPYAIPEGTNVVLAVNRQLPEGEHVFSIKLVNGTEFLYLKQKFVSQNSADGSELGISLESICLHDPWFMNNQAKERHEHTLTIAGHNIIIVYFAYDTDHGEDIEYILYERMDITLEKPIKRHAFYEALAYALSIPATPLHLLHIQKPQLISALHSSLGTVTRRILSSHKTITEGTVAYSLIGKRLTEHRYFESNIETLATLEAIKSATNKNFDSLAGSVPRQSKNTIQNAMHYSTQEQSWHSVIDSRITSRFWLSKNNEYRQSQKSIPDY